MEIIKLVMLETNGMGIGIPSRPYEMDVRMDTRDILNDLDELTVGGTTINSTTISRLASGILVPSNNPRDTNIDGGWNEKRIIFSMVIGVEDRGRYREVRYISGYTDRIDYVIDSRGRAKFPDDMRLYFNSVSKISLMEVASRGGNMIRPTIMDNNLMLRKDSIISDLNDRNKRGRRGDTPMLLRPTDLLKRQGSQQHLASFTSSLMEPTVHNTIGKFALPTQLSKRSNNNSAEHMADTIRGYIQARAGSEDSATSALHHNNDDNADYMTQAATITSEATTGSDPFFHELKSFSNIVTEGYVEWGELMEFDPEFEKRGEFPLVTWNAQVKNYNRKKREGGADTRGPDKYHNSASFYENTVESTCALLIAQAMPQILSNAMYSSVSGVVLNSHPQHGEPHVHMAMAHPFIDGIPVEQGYRYFTTMLQNVVLPNVTKNGVFHVEAMVNASIDGDIEVWISVDGGPEEYFPYPAWAESLISPVVTDDERDLEVISQGVAGLVQDFALQIENNSPRLVEKATTRDIFRSREQETFEAAPSNGGSNRNYGGIDLGL